MPILLTSNEGLLPNFARALSIGWCAGWLNYLKSNLRIEDILDEIESADNPNQEYFPTRIVETVGQVKESTNDLLKVSSKVLEKIEMENRPLLDNEEEFPTMPQLDPGMRSNKLTDI